MNSEQYLASLKAAQDKFDREVSALAERIRKEVIIPLCKRHKLTFTSGMGTFFFTDSKGRDYGGNPLLPGANASKAISNAVKSVLALLDEEVSHNQCLGYYVGDVNAGDYLRSQ